MGIVFKPFSPDDLIKVVRTAGMRLLKSGRDEPPSTLAGGPLLSSSSALPSFAQLDAIAKSDSTMLITGGSEVGKEMLARLIHNQSPRARNPWVIVDCASLPETLLEDEMFGHVKGAFTGAMDDRQASWEAAEGGTIFLRNIAATPIALQSKLLHAIETREINRIGSTEAQRVNVRVIADSPHPLLLDVKEGRFREDLFYRLSVVTIDLPLREPSEQDYRIVKANVESMIVESALRFAGGNKRGAARLLGMSPGLLYRRLKELQEGMLRPTPRDK